MQRNQNNMHFLINNTKSFIVQQRKATTSIIFRYVCEIFQRYRSIGLENRQANTIKKHIRNVEKKTLSKCTWILFICVYLSNECNFIAFRKRVCSWIRANLSMLWCMYILYCSAFKFKFRAKIALHFVAN